MRRNLFVASLFAFAAVLGLGCGTPNDESSFSDQEMAELRACKLTPTTVGPGGHLRACDPQDVKKTTICHIPPGNPANAHTICVGNPAVSAHVTHHGDYVGPCQNETPCPTGAAGAGGGGDAGQGGGSTGSGGSAGSGGPIVP